jgi:hypothetical protein
MDLIYAMFLYFSQVLVTNIEKVVWPSRNLYKYRPLTFSGDVGVVGVLQKLKNHQFVNNEAASDLWSRPMRRYRDGVRRKLQVELPNCSLR